MYLVLLYVHSKGCLPPDKLNNNDFHLGNYCELQSYPLPQFVASSTLLEGSNHESNFEGKRWFSSLKEREAKIMMHLRHAVWTVFCQDVDHYNERGNSQAGNALIFFLHALCTYILWVEWHAIDVCSGAIKLKKLRMSRTVKVLNY